MRVVVDDDPGIVDVTTNLLEVEFWSQKGSSVPTPDRLDGVTTYDVDDATKVYLVGVYFKLWS